MQADKKKISYLSDFEISGFGNSRIVVDQK